VTFPRRLLNGSLSRRLQFWGTQFRARRGMKLCFTFSRGYPCASICCHVGKLATHESHQRRPRPFATNRMCTSVGGKAKAKAISWTSTIHRLRRLEWLLNLCEVPTHRSTDADAAPLHECAAKVRRARGVKARNTDSIHGRARSRVSEVLMSIVAS
jgi:hypothetical protein